MMEGLAEDHALAAAEPIEAAVAMPGYDPVAQLFHWATALLMFSVLVPLGLYAHWIGDGARRTYLLEHWHKPFGLLVIVLTLVRLAWKGHRPAVVEARGLQRWERALARVAHWALYALLLAMPLSGLLMSQGAGRPTPFFGLFDIPQFLPLDPGLAARAQPAYKLGKLLHGTILSWSIYGIVFVHIAGALKHRFVDGDRAYLARMWRVRPRPSEVRARP